MLGLASMKGYIAMQDKTNQFQQLIIDPEDIKTKQQQPGILYVATSCAKTIGDMTLDTPHPKASALYWTGTGISINMVLDGITKRQQNSQQHERVNCLNIEKRHKWVTYLTKQKELLMKDTYNKE
jgi:hypothetical protein